MNRHGRIPMLSLVLALSLLTSGARAADRDADFAQARQDFAKAADDDAGALERARAGFEKLAEADPQDPVALAYAGATAAKLGGTARWPWQKLTRTNAGLARIDQALGKLGPQHDGARPGALPAALETLLVAASTYVEVPDGHFHRLADGKKALAAAFAHPRFGELPPSVLARFHWIAAQVARAEQVKDAERTALERSLAADPSGPLAPRIHARLAELSA